MEFVAVMLFTQQVFQLECLFLFWLRLILTARKTLIFSQMFWKDSISKKIAQEHDLSCIIWKDGIFFPEDMIFSCGRKIKDDLSQKILGNAIFSVHMYKCYKYDIALLQKKSKMIVSRKKTTEDD